MAWTEPNPQKGNLVGIYFLVTRLLAVDDGMISEWLILNDKKKGDRGLD